MRGAPLSLDALMGSPAPRHWQEQPRDSLSGAPEQVSRPAPRAPNAVRPITPSPRPPANPACHRQGPGGGVDAPLQAATLPAFRGEVCNFAQTLWAEPAENDGSPTLNVINRNYL
jgi:hypothetical protein